MEWLETDPATAREVREQIAQNLDARVNSGALSRSDREAILSRLRLATDYTSSAEAEFVVEAASEDFAAKRLVLREIERAVPPRTLVATSSSRFSVAKLGEGLKHVDRFLGMHFVNPDPEATVVELAGTPATAERILVEARSICVKLGATPVKVKDSPGLIGSRVSRPLFLEALRLVETGEADIGTVDQTMRQLGGMERGPFELMDRLGLDVELATTEALHADLGRPAHLAPGAVQRKLVAAGHFGCRSGRGFYDYAHGQKTPAYEAPLKNVHSWKATAALRELAASLGRPAEHMTWVFARIFAAVVNEAARAADTIALPRDVNLVMELGYGFAEGPLAVADHVGLDIVQRLLREFHEDGGADQRFAPNPLLDRHVSEGRLGEKTAKGFLHHSL